MQVSKVGCVGKTYALAKQNDSSGGKRSKRRSKEERKGMVETFVKRHQASNNGSFPSLHLTHKEVGGSYYTVREIFRELIQENRVLAPPNLSPREQNMKKLDSFLDNYQLGSISFDPNVHGSPPKDNRTLLNEYEIRRQKILNSKKISELHRQNLDDDIINRSTHTTVKKEEIIDAEASELSGNDVVEATDATLTNTINEEHMHIESSIEKVVREEKNQGFELQLEPKVSNMPEAIVVEATPATLSNEEFEQPKHTKLLPQQDMERQKDEREEVETHQGQMHHFSENVVVETFPLRPVSSEFDDIDDILSEKEVLLKSENTSFADKHLISASSRSLLQQSSFKKTTANKKKSDIRSSGTAQRQMVDTTLNRTNPKSWEDAAASKKSDSQETNQLVSFINTCVAAFMKFWSK